MDTPGYGTTRCVLVLLLAVCAPWGCRDTASRNRSGAKRPNAVEERRSLLDQVSRAELWRDGLIMDLGTPDQHKYIRTALKTGWGASKREGAITYVELEREGTATYDDWRGEAVSVAIMARASRAGQRLGVELEHRDLGVHELSTSWRVLEMPRVPRREPGRRTLRLRPVPAGSGPVHVQWIWFRSCLGLRPNTTRLADHTLGTTRRALVAPTPTTYSFYLRVPPRAHLAVGHGARRPCRFLVTATTDAGVSHSLLEAHVTGGPWWHEVRVDLASVADMVVRLDLAVVGGRGGPLGAAWARPRLLVPALRAALPQITPRNNAKNLVLVVVDAARRDAYRAFNARAVAHTPAVSALAREGVSFAGAQVNASHTVASVASMITGRYPHTLLGAGRHTPMGADVPTLSEHLRRSGFATALLTANPFLSRPFGFHRQQDLYRSYPIAGADKGTRRIFDEALSWATEQRRRGRRFFLHVHTMDPHHPYRNHPEHTPRYLGRDRGARPAELRSLSMGGGPGITARQRRLVRALYHGEIAAHDVELGRFLSGLRRHGLLDRTLVVFSSDHGEELFDHGRNEHGQTLYEEVLRTPLVLRLPSLLPAGRKVRHPVEMVDLLPTVLELLDLPPLAGVHGRSLFPVAHGRAPREPEYVTAETGGLSLRLGPFKLIQRETERLLFDLRADPGERTNLVGSHAVVARTLEARLGEALAVPHKDRRLFGVGHQEIPATRAPVLTPQLRRQLQSLGYIQ